MVQAGRPARRHGGLDKQLGGVGGQKRANPPDVEEEESTGACCLRDVIGEVQPVVKGDNQALHRSGGSYCGAVNSNRELLKRRGLGRDEQQISLVQVKLEMVGGHPFGDVGQACRDLFVDLGGGRRKRKE
ncbi:hypothetical protein MATL_G00264100 [Megalops atlanticus]|uniref:Uncharacterized protein n=1 Tax=Megalops atlanticus TaxID=7932 RepID=A0A9D3PBD8_MEGAT|nr:hypothetical protein MATL_G00264100 [Megalops atlanticus]